MNRKNACLFVSVLVSVSTLLVVASGAQPSADRILVCHASNAAKASVVKLIKDNSLASHLDHGDCRIATEAQPGAACDRTDLDGDDVCGSVGTLTCGDGAGPGGSDDHCACGDTVISNTVIDAALDPVAATSCNGNGLHLADGITLDLEGITLTGSNSGTGLTVSGSAEVHAGTLQGFGIGIHVAPAAPGASVTVNGTTLHGNAGDGAQVDVTDPQGRIVFEQVIAEANGGDGIHVRAAPGASNLDDAADRQERSAYGFVLQGATSGGNAPQVRNNLGHGIHLGDPAQAADVSALIDFADVYGNGGTGILVEQKTGLAPGADCGTSAGQPGCTGATLFGSLIHANTGAGLELRSGVLIPVYVPGVIDHGLGFLGNQVFGNALASASCTAAQSAPQVSITGPVGLGNAACTLATDETSCASANSPVNQHCVWTGSSCAVAWDLRGDVHDSCANGVRNGIIGYNVSDSGSLVSVGMRATGNAIVWADHNEWQSTTSSQNASQGAGSFIKADMTCGTRGCPLP